VGVVGEDRPASVLGVDAGRPGGADVSVADVKQCAIVVILMCQGLKLKLCAILVAPNSQIWLNLFSLRIDCPG